MSFLSQSGPITSEKQIDNDNNHFVRTTATTRHKTTFNNVQQKFHHVKNGNISTLNTSATTTKSITINTKTAKQQNNNNNNNNNKNFYIKPDKKNPHWNAPNKLYMATFLATWNSKVGQPTESLFIWTSLTSSNVHRTILTISNYLYLEINWTISYLKIGTFQTFFLSVEILSKNSVRRK